MSPSAAVPVVGVSLFVDSVSVSLDRLEQMASVLLSDGTLLYHSIQDFSLAHHNHHCSTVSVDFLNVRLINGPQQILRLLQLQTKTLNTCHT